jgi:phosphatidylglycerophosphatase A
LPASAAVQATAIAALFAIGSWSGTVAERHFGTRDPAPVVIDEVMGMIVTLFLNPVGWAGAVGAFLLFRIADVVKPFPADRHGGTSASADDAGRRRSRTAAALAVASRGNRVT